MINILKYLKIFFFVGTIGLLQVSCEDKDPVWEEDDISHLLKPVPDDGSNAPGSKTLYIPSGSIWDVPANNDFNDWDSRYSLLRKQESANFAMLWDKEFGNNIAAATGADIPRVFGFLEDTYAYFAHELKFVEKGNSLTDDYKMLVFIRGGQDQTAYGGGAMDSIGILWMPSTRLNEPYTTLAHELGHSFQYMVHADGNWGFSSNSAGSNGQVLWEMTSQFMTMMVFPEWMTIEDWHLVNFMENTHLAFLHEDMRYASPYVLIYWTDKYGIDFVGKLWRTALQSEDPVKTYKRMIDISQEEFNDDIFEAYRKFITWDIPLIRKTEADKYANQHHTKLVAQPGDWYRITPEKCPQNYGYNGVKLNIPDAGTTIQLDFKGLAGISGYRAIQVEKAGWRYGFVAQKDDGTRIYSDIFSDDEGTASFEVPENTSNLWLIVSGAPTEHWEHLWDENADNDEQWPYEIKLTGTTIEESMIQY